MNCLRNLVIAGIGFVSVVNTYSLVIAGEQQDTVNANEVAVRQAGKAYIEALQRGQADALVARWTAEGVYIDAAGKSFTARELIRQHFGQESGGEVASRATVDPNATIRFVTSNVAIEQGVSQSTSDGAAGRYTAIWVKQGGKWLLDNLQESEAASSVRDNPLDALGWMIGNWEADDGDFTVRCSARWTENRKFILRRFTVERDAETLHGTQRIGWDAAAASIRSWGFDSDGGIHEGRWRSEGDSWIVKTTGVLPNGDRSSAVNFWIPEGPDRCVLKTSHVMVGDVEVEDFVVEFERVNRSR